MAKKMGDPPPKKKKKIEKLELSEMARTLIEKFIFEKKLKFFTLEIFLKFSEIPIFYFFSSPGGRGEASYLVEKLDMESPAF